MKVSFLDEKRFVWARFQDPWSIGELIGTVDSLLSECLAKKQDLLLIDLGRLHSRRLSVFDRYRLASSTASFSGKLAKVACVAPSSMIDPEKFGERVAQNRGVNIRVFREEDAAQRWLLEE
jgi:hypothetical protein